MKLSKIFFLILCITGLSIFYVWQQTEIVRLAYEGQRSMVAFKDLLDENSLLRYNLSRNTSLTKIAYKTSDNDDFKMPDKYCLVKLALPKDRAVMASQYSVTRENLLARIFGIRRQAEANTLNP